MKRHMMMSTLSYFVLFAVSLSFLLVGNSDMAFAVCCFPYEMTHHVDSDTGHLIVQGQLYNDSYRGEPFGNVNYQFEFLDAERNVLFERDITLTDGLPIGGGFTIPPGMALPFHFTIDDMDKETIMKVDLVSSGRTNNLDYFSWKPADLKVELENLKQIAAIPDPPNQDILFYKWKASGTITNMHSQTTENVYVVASILDENYGFLGSAGYAEEEEDDIQPLALDGLETKYFALHFTLPIDKTPDIINLYAESDDSSMIHQRYNPVILKNILNIEAMHATDPTKPIAISANVTNISRENLEADWIIQIKKVIKKYQ